MKISTKAALVCAVLGLLKAPDLRAYKGFEEFRASLSSDFGIDLNPTEWARLGSAAGIALKAAGQAWIKHQYPELSLAEAQAFIAMKARREPSPVTLITTNERGEQGYELLSMTPGEMVSAQEFIYLAAVVGRTQGRIMVLAEAMRSADFDATHAEAILKMLFDRPLDSSSLELAPRCLAAIVHADAFRESCPAILKTVRATVLRALQPTYHIGLRYAALDCVPLLLEGGIVGEEVIHALEGMSKGDPLRSQLERIFWRALRAAVVAGGSQASWGRQLIVDWANAGCCSYPILLKMKEKIGQPSFAESRLCNAVEAAFKRLPWHKRWLGC